LFRHPYTKIEFVMQVIQVNRVTASKYLSMLTKDGWLILHKIGRTNYYINHRLVALLRNAPIR
jgi:predicted transcriptional regulator of viral defense system